MSSIFKKIKSAFIIEEEQKASAKAKKAREPEDASHTPADEVQADKTPLPEIKIDIETGDGQVSKKFTNVLLKALEANNQEGFDYIEFKRAVQNLFKLDMGEENTYKSAFATAQTMGATPQGLVDSAQKYLQVLAAEEKKFESALIKQRDKQVQSRVTNLQKMEASIAGKEQKIEQLRQEIEAEKKKLQTVRTEIEEATIKVESTGKDFVVSYRHLVKQIQQDIDNIGKYLQ